MDTDLERQILQHWARRESRPAQQLFARLYGRRILWFFTRKLNDTADAEDALADYNAALWAALLRDPPPAEGGLTTWVYKLARRIRRRKERSRVRKVARYSPEDQDMLPQESADGPSRQLERAERRALFARLRTQLTDDERELITLVFESELPQRDVAEILGISWEAVRARLSRLMAKLRGLHAAA